MALSKAVICTRIPGQTDTVVDGETGLYVPPEDPAALRAAIERLLANPDEAARMGKAGNARLHAEGMTIDKYAERLARIVSDTV
jgi:glycosyltransferase involved in cell wall biosynthesis